MKKITAELMPLNLLGYETRSSIVLSMQRLGGRLNGTSTVLPLRLVLVCALWSKSCYITTPHELRLYADRIKVYTISRINEMIEPHCSTEKQRRFCFFYVVTASSGQGNSSGAECARMADIDIVHATPASLHRSY